MSSSRRRRRRTAALCALVALPASLTAMAPAREAAPEPAPDSVYAVALGDGFIAGEAARWKGNAEGDWAKGGVPAELRAATDRTQAENLPLDSVYAPSASDCHRSDTAEIHGAKGAPSPHGEIAFPLNLACSGAQTRHVLSEPYRSERPQLEQLKALLASERTKVGYVVVSVGGSALPEAARTCAASWKANAYCSTDPAVTEPVLKSVKAAEQEAADTVAKVKEALAAAGSSARIVLQSYPATLAPGDPATTAGDEHTWNRWSTFGCPFYNRDLAWLNTEVYPALSASLKKAATAQQVSFLDVRRLPEGHEVCQKATHQAELTTRGRVYLPSAADAQWARYFERSKTPLPATDEAESLHPNFYGQQALRTCLSDALRKIAQAGQNLALQCAGAQRKAPTDVTATTAAG
ncbi:hypothetical protein [Streptomyces sp. NPDC003036]|uniref:hypothetical protein n=1 Tax=Streptomyces sp. NPDC003036 TaxID=3154442 RepID=UPI0033B68144